MRGEDEKTPTVPRRDFLKVSAIAATVSLLGHAPAAAEAPHGYSPLHPPSGLIDVNVNLSRWPLRSLRYDRTPDLVAKLRGHGVAQAWAGSFDALLHKDLREVNARLADECRRHGRGMMLPFGSVNPARPDWEEELRRCAEEHKMRGIRLHPNYHGYKLDDPAFARLFGLAAERRLIVQIALMMEDERMMNPVLRVPPVDPAPLGDLLKRFPVARVVLLNAMSTLSGDRLSTLTKAGEVHVEISMLEGVGGVAGLLKTVSSSRILFGSYAPLFYFESALLKLHESEISADDLKLIGHENARRVMSEGGLKT